MLTKKKLEEWVTVIRIAVDPGSPFQGVVDLSGVFSLPLADQHQIWDALPSETRAALKAGAALNKEG